MTLDDNLIPEAVEHATDWDAVEFAEHLEHVRETSADRLYRHGDVTPDWKPQRTQKPARRRVGDVALAWKLAVTEQGCDFHDNPADCEMPVQAAHVISQQTLRRHGHADKLWDVRNGVSACYRAHRRSDSGVERFPREKLPAAVFEFADELGLRWVLDRLYPASEAAA